MGLRLIKNKSIVKKNASMQQFPNLSEIQNTVTRGQVDMSRLKKEKTIIHSWKEKPLNGPVLAVEFSFLLKEYAEL